MSEDRHPERSKPEELPPSHWYEETLELRRKTVDARLTAIETTLKAQVQKAAIQKGFLGGIVFVLSAMWAAIGLVFALFASEIKSFFFH